jgi:predicted PurR-regulated permease PerM
MNNLPFSNQIYSFFLIAILVFTLYLGFLVLSPFLHTIIFAAILTALFYPVYRFFVRKIKDRECLASLTVLFIIFFGVFIPLFLFISGLVGQGIDSIDKINSWLHTVDFKELLDRYTLNEALTWIQNKLPFVDWKSIDFQSSLLAMSKSAGQSLFKLGQNILGNITVVLINFLLLLFLMFYFFIDGPNILSRVKYLSPLCHEQEEAIIANIRSISHSVVMGGLAVAFLQGLAGGIALWIAGMPGLFWGTMMGFASLVPVVGTALIWVPAAAYLFLTGQIGMGVFFTLWSIIVVGSIDNFVRPLIMKGTSGLSTMYLFLSIMGGIQVFGMKGLLYGPLSLGMAVVMLRIYSEEYKDLLSQNDCPSRTKTS